MFWNEHHFRPFPSFRGPRWNPFRELAQLQAELTPAWQARLAGVHLPGAAISGPPVNVWRNGDRLLVATQAPGLKQDEVAIEIEGETLRITQRYASTQTAPAAETAPTPEPAATAESVPQAAQAAEAAAEPSAFAAYREERWQGEFTRTLTLPFPVEAAQVKARLQKGILWIELPRAAADRPRTIPVQSTAQ